MPTIDAPPKKKQDKPIHGNSLLTTGRVARMLRVAPRTVAIWCNTGKLKCYRVPGGLDRRILRDDLVAFLAASNYPMPAELAAGIALAVNMGDCAALNLPGWEIADVFTAGALCAKRPVSFALVGDECGVSQAVAVATRILAAHPAAAAVIVVSEDAPGVLPGWSGRVVRRPVDLGKLAGELTSGGTV